MGLTPHLSSPLAGGEELLCSENKRLALNLGSVPAVVVSGLHYWLSVVSYRLSVVPKKRLLIADNR